MTKRIVISSFSALLLVAACGGSNKSTAPAATPEPAAAPAAATAAPATEAAAAKDPEGPLTEAQCEEAMTHAEGLLDADPQTKQFAEKMRENHGKFLADCVEKAKQKDYDCLMAAKVFQDMASCGEPGK